jgi:multimeric flavodoxin WrbA
MRAIVLNGTLKKSPAESNTDALARYVGGVLGREHGVEVEHVRLVDHVIEPGVETEAQSQADEWPSIHERLLAAEILIVATPTWLGQISSVTKRALERMDALISETTDDGTPVAFNRVAGVVVTGNEDGAHACIANIAQALIDIGYTIPGQAWTYWNKGPGPGDEEYLTTGEREWTHSTGDAAAHVLFHTASALREHAIPKPPNA